MPERYEYSSPVTLDGIAGNYYVIPASVILAKDANDKRTSIFSFFSVHRGLNYKVLFSVNSIVKWLGRKPDRHKNGLNEKIINTILSLEDWGYITLFDELNHTSFTDSLFNMNQINDDCNNDRFAVVYVDELEKIIQYKNPNSKDVYLNSDVILTVFAYLRMKIYRRRNKLFPEEINIDNKNNHQYDIGVRLLRSPDAYDCYFFEIAEDLGLTPRTVSKAVTVLKELGLIYYESLPRIKRDDKWRTDHTVFCNMYKREGTTLLTDGESYYLSEIENKRKRLNIVDNRKDKSKVKE